MEHSSHLYFIVVHMIRILILVVEKFIKMGMMTVPLSQSDVRDMGFCNVHISPMGLEPKKDESGFEKGRSGP